SLESQAQNALLPNTVDPGSLLNAITLVSLANFGSRLVGPLVGAPMLAGVGAGWIFVMAAGFYALSVVLTSRVRLRSTGGLAGSISLLRDAGRGLAEAFRYVGANPQIRLVIAVVTLHCLLTMSFDALLPILAKDVFDGGTSLFSAMLMGIGAGALVGTLGLSFVRNPAVRGRLFFATGLLSGATMVWTGLAPTEAWVVAGTAATGAAQAMFVALSATLIQSVLPDHIRGRVMSLYALFAGGVMAFMIFSNGSASDVVSVRVLLWGPGLLFVVLLLGWALVHADLRRVIDRGVLYLGREPDGELMPTPAGGD
ncbi:MAG TPA: MFS transporter, partial [Dehalococcoidia bacterium]|nr:MFS transporter [Dehalococcoidia bacterium]